MISSSYSDVIGKNVTSPLHYWVITPGAAGNFTPMPALEGVVSERADAAYVLGNRGLWVKVKCLHREEFVVVGWTTYRSPSGAKASLNFSLSAPLNDPV